ncbi:MAG: aminotransferase class IV, partial [Candidatus Omnitrophica bacterium]|nr:aminotransferase class IV [Candidatus Omnitrophota bacterium]
MSDSRQILLTLDDHPAPHTDALGWQWAYGCFETFCWSDGTAIGLEKHLDRLLLGCRELSLECLLEKRDLEKRLKAALDPFGEKRLRVRLEAVLDDLGLMRGDDPPFRMRIGVRARETRFASAQSPFSITLLTEKESAPFFPMPSYKPLAYGARLRMRNRLLRQQLTEAIVVTEDLRVVSGLTSNLFVRTSEGVWLSPNLESGCLPGVTRAL